MKTEQNTTCRFLKIDSVKKVVYSIVLVPDEEDLQEDIIPKEEVEKAAHNFLLKYRTIGDMHEKVALAAPVESYILPADITIGEDRIPAGSWIMATKVFDEALWARIESGEITGMSIGGWSYREEINAV